jgi:hypothetical protein
MPDTEALPTAEQQRAYLTAQRRGYELAAHELFRSWCVPSEASKLAFDRLMQDACQHRKSARTCTMHRWYAALLRTTHE